MERAEKEKLMEEKRCKDEIARDDIPTNSKQTHNSNTTPNPTKAKSCKGCLYYSSSLKSHSRNPLCVGITRSLPQVPRNIVGKSELEANEKGREFADFKYGCVGYSVYSDRKGQKDVQDKKSELPACIGIEVLVDRKVTAADSVPAHTHAHNREDNHRLPQPRTQKPAQSLGDEFLKRFTRNAGVVAKGVAKNARKVGNQLKSTLDDVLYPYRRRPK
ncbi:Altered inheritance of mitochondria 23, mitochondrial [Heracleum sosnowskyi]|uniref:Altered inheritance of mitochondria 23, mitochondrial n=1 Tax=Heracleum sosnowskyi TaxID=360622 RepID=A0AAD8HWY0_9APIA|nr:Altered inheritance of mitochondria 23, mitochondrial [Heracleum sosnowskyi]